MIKVVGPILVVLSVFILLILVAFVSTVKPVPTTNLCVNVCGNGTCQEIGCLGQGCPCIENSATCPQDCGR